MLIRGKKILLEIDKDKADIVYLQETHLENQEHEKLKKWSNSQILYSSYNSKRSSNIN